MRKILLSIGWDSDSECPYLLQRHAFCGTMSVDQRIEFLEAAIKEMQKVIHSSKVLSEFLAHKQA
jgi:hypothetical protein